MKLSAARNNIDAIDRKIIQLLEERFVEVQKIKEYKIKTKLLIEDLSREQEIIMNIKKYCSQDFLDMVIQVYQTIFKSSKELQK